MNTDAILFYSIVVMITTFCFRLVFINIKVRRYIKKYHHDVWEGNIWFSFYGGSGAVGPNIFQVIERIGLNDPKIEDYKKEWEKVLKQLLLVVLLAAILAFCYLAFYKNNGIIGKVLFRKIIGTVI